jgi:hypothetical protein
VPVEDQVGKGVGAQFVQVPLTAALAGSPRVCVDHVVRRERLRGAQMGVQIAGALAAVRAMGDLAGLQIVLNVPVCVARVDPIDGPVQTTAQVVRRLSGSALQDVVFETLCNGPRHLLGDFGRLASPETEVVVIVGQRGGDLADDHGSGQIQTSLRQRLQRLGEPASEGDGGFDKVTGLGRAQPQPEH